MSDVEEGYVSLEESEHDDAIPMGGNGDEAAGSPSQNDGYVHDDDDENFELERGLMILEEIVEDNEEIEADKGKAMVYDPIMCCYYAGPEALQSARSWISQYAVRSIAARIDARCRRFMFNHPRTAQRGFQDVTLYKSQIDDIGPLSSCQFSPNSRLLATASSAGTCKIWTVPGCQLHHTLVGHTSNVGAIVFHPKATTMEETPCHLASCGGDDSVKLWSLSSVVSIANIDVPKPLKVAFHPSGRFLATCCFDSTWRLLDLERCAVVLKQEGSKKPVCCISFSVDGEVCATGSLDTLGRVWDLRSGLCINYLDGHRRPIYGIDFSAEGYYVATVSQDNTCVITDVRTRNILHRISAHSNNISDVKYQKDRGDYLVTGSYDKTVKIWKESSGELLKTLSDHEDKVTSVDVSPDSAFVASCSYDGQFKLWSTTGLTL